MAAWTAPSHWRTRPAKKGVVMRALRVSLTGTFILALLGGSGGALAQGEAEDSGTVTVEYQANIGSGEDVDGTFWIASLVGTSDPRLSGTWTENWKCQPGSGFEVCVGTVRAENEGGTWLGRVEGFSHADGSFDWTVLEGQGGYEGLTAIRVIGEMTEEMVILDFGLPTQPEPKLPPE